jgi:hypothetical protein
VEEFAIIAEIPKTGDSYTANIFMERERSVIVLTDKPVYRPGEVINFRVLVINKDTKPYRFESAEIALTDPNKNKVKSLGIPQSTTGFYQASLRLSDEATAGKWEIQVEIENDKQITSKTFEVREYVRPRFEAIIDTKQDVSIDDVVLNATFFGRYTFGGLVQGKAKISIYVHEGNVNTAAKHVLNIEKTIPSKEMISFNLRKDLKLTTSESTFVKFELTFEENLTKSNTTVKKVVHVSTQSSSQRADEEIEIVGDEGFKPGLPYQVKVTLRDEKGQLVKNSKINQLRVDALHYIKPKNSCASELTKDTFQEEELNRQYFKVADGVADLSIETSTNDNAISLMYYFRSKYLKTINIFRSPSRSREYIEAKISRIR